MLTRLQRWVWSEQLHLEVGGREAGFRALHPQPQFVLSHGSLYLVPILPRHQAKLERTHVIT